MRRSKAAPGRVLCYRNTTVISLMYKGYGDKCNLLREETMVDEAERERIRRLSNEELAEELGQEAEKVNLTNPVYSERYIELLNEFDRRFDSGEIEEPEVPEDFIPRVRDIIRQLPPPSHTRGQPDTSTTEHTHEGCKREDTERGREGP